MNEEILRLSDVTISYGKKTVVTDVSFALHKGEILGLVGESGSGKSTIIKACMGLLGENGKAEGEILFMGKNMAELKEKEMAPLRGKYFGMIFQDSGASLSPIRKIGDQIVETIRSHEDVSKEEAKKMGIDLLLKLGFDDPERVWDSYPFELSGGMNQRAGIAIAEVLNPPVLLADEPTSALDVAVQKQVMEEMKRVRELFGTSIILVSHDISFIAAMSDNVIVLKNGKIVEYGKAEDVLENPQEEYTKKLMAAVPKLRRER